MRGGGARFELRMELGAYEERVVLSAGDGPASGGQLDDFYEICFRVHTGNHEPGFL